MKTSKTILVVEDEKYLREALTDILKLKGFLTLEAKNGRDGVEVAILKHPDLVLLDLIMPEMDGTEALRKIRENKWGAKVPVIILTNLSATKDRPIEDVTTHKFVHYLIKSDWKLLDIVKEIERILNIESHA